MNRPLRPVHPAPGRSRSRRIPPWVALLVALLLVHGVLPSATGEVGSGANGSYSHTLPGPLLGIAGSEDGTHLAVMDSDGRYTFLLDGGERERSWSAPTKGTLGLLGIGVLDAPPQPVAVSMTPDGEHWAAATAYGENHGGMVSGFAQWSDEPIWTYQMADGDWDNDAIQPTALASGGGFHAVGTSEGKVHLLAAQGTEGSDKKPKRTYKQSNTGEPFGSINSVAVSQDGGLILIGTETDGVPALHLYTDIFFKATFTRVTTSVEKVAIAADGTRGAATTGTGESTRVHFVDTQKGTTIWEHTIGSSATSLTLSHDGTLLAVGTEAGRVHVYEERGQARDSEPRRTFSFDSGVTSVKASNQPGAIVAGTENGRVHLLDLERSKPLWSFEAPGDSATVTVGGDLAMIAAATRTGEEGAVTFLEAEHALEHRVQSLPRLVPAKEQSIPVELLNNGNRMAKIAVEWTALPNHWEGKDSEILLAPGESGTLQATLSLPPGQPEGDFQLAFNLKNGPLQIPVEVTARVPQVTSGQAVQVWAFEKAVPGGAPAAFVMQLSNTGNTINEIALGYSGLPADWNAEFTGPTEMGLRPGEDRQTVFTLDAPADASVGDVVWVDLVFAWQHGEQRHPLRIEVIDQDRYIFGLKDVIENSSLPDDDRIGPLLERLTKAAEQPVSTQGDVSGTSVLIPMGGLLMPVGALGAALLLTLLVVGRKRQPDPSGPQRAEVRLKREDP